MSLLRRCPECHFSEDAWNGKPHTPLQLRYPLTCLRSRMEDGEPSDPSTLAFTMDGSRFRGELLVSPSYGCVMWQPRAQVG